MYFEVNILRKRASNVHAGTRIGCWLIEIVGWHAGIEWMKTCEREVDEIWKKIELFIVLILP